jgi:predicted flap endonuclease-1-like 5' DNA nuclease
MSYSIDTIEGIGAAYKEKLAEVDIQTTEDLLDRAGGAAGRKALAEAIHVDERMVLEWVNRADLMRITGVGEEFSDLLENAGVDTVKELATRNPENLTEKMEEVNGDGVFSRRTPAQSEVERWVEEAKGLDPRVSH